MPRIYAVVFDLDGVLVDSALDIANAVNATLMKMKINKMDMSDILPHVGHGASYLLEKCMCCIDSKKSVEALDYYKAYYSLHSIENTELYDGISDLLGKLEKANINMAVLTNKPEPLAIQILEKLSVINYFRVIFGPETAGTLKPDPTGLLKILRIIKTEPEAALMVGDMKSDIATGKNAGTYTCGATYGLGTLEDIMKAEPDIMVSSPGEIYDWINKKKCGAI